MSDGLQKPESYIGNHVESEQVEEQTLSSITGDDATYLQTARDAYTNSTDYLDANIRKQIEKNLRLFNSQHPAGSKYHQDAYKFRSKFFRPKTRSSIRKHEAAAALAFFSTTDMVSCSAEDSRDESSVLGARYGKNWLEYRLEHSIKWFETVIGAYQDAMVQGIVISRQEWLFEEVEVEYEDIKRDAFGLIAEINAEGNFGTEKKKRTDILSDKPDISLIPVENFRFSIAADWRDPIGTSPFLIEMMPMFVGDVKRRMNADNPKTGEKKWNELSDEAILTAGRKTGDYDSTRLVREGHRQDSKDPDSAVNQFEIVWVHRNIIRDERGVDMLYYTLGTEHLLSKPVPCKEVFLHGRPYTIGSAIIETHKQYPASLAQLTQDLQGEANDVANQRLDNIKLILNKRYRGKRGANVDWRALTRSTPGGIIMMDNLKDVEEESFTDVTGSSYQEQDRISADFDELSGSFSGSSVKTQRSLNETVGGMAMLNDDSDIMTEYQIRTFCETWAEDTLRMVMDMGKHYETDERVLSIIGEGEEVNTVTELLDTKYNVRLSMGFGATSPHKRIEKLSIGLKTIGEFLPHKISSINGDEVMNEVFGALGYRDGSRFFYAEESEDPQIAQLNEKIKELEGMVAGKQMQEDTKLKVAEMKGQTDLQREQMRGQLELQKLQMQQDLLRDIENLKGEMTYIGHQIAAEKNDIARGELILQQETLQFQLQGKELQMLASDNDKLSQVLANDRYGMVAGAEDTEDGKKGETYENDEVL